MISYSTALLNATGHAKALQDDVQSTESMAAINADVSLASVRGCRLKKELAGAEDCRPNAPSCRSSCMHHDARAIRL